MKYLLGAYRRVEQAHHEDWTFPHRTQSQLGPWPVARGRRGSGGGCRRYREAARLRRRSLSTQTSWQQWHSGVATAADARGDPHLPRWQRGCHLTGAAIHEAGRRLAGTTSGHKRDRPVARQPETTPGWAFLVNKERDCAAGAARSTRGQAHDAFAHERCDRDTGCEAGYLERGMRR
jgi:hypothetical protein